MRKKKKMTLNPNDYCKRLAIDISNYINKNFEMVDFTSKELDNMFMLVHYHTKKILAFNTEPNDDSISEGVDDMYDKDKEDFIYEQTS